MVENLQEDFIFADEEESKGGILKKEKNEVNTVNNWKILIVDDDEEVHTVTKLALKRFCYNERQLEFLHAYSGKEGFSMLSENNDIAVILLDVVMESDDAGLKLARSIREKLYNKLVRIILRTGQPGQAPEEEVIINYDINDYKEKTELTSGKLFTTMVTALRAYDDMSIIEQTKKGLQKVIEASSTIFKIQSMTKFANGVLEQLVALLRLQADGKNNMLYENSSAFVGTKKSNHELVPLTATGRFLKYVGVNMDKLIEPDVWDVIEKTYQSDESSFFFKDRFIMYFESQSGLENIIYFEGVNKLSEWERHIIEIFGKNTSIAFENIYLTQEVEDTQKDVIFTLGEVAEARSHETGLHVKRVAEIAYIIALRYGVSETEAEKLRMAAPVHDIGKLAVADAVLNKPGKLTEDEFALMRNHAKAGYSMLEGASSDILNLGALVALQHHECYDGSGYPHGLKGEEIHLFARIVAIADVFDALGNDRVYKKAWPLSKIVAYLKEKKGTQFDPKLVDIFIENIDEIEAIRKKFPDNIK